MTIRQYNTLPNQEYPHVMRFSKSSMELADATDLDLLDDVRLNLSDGSERLKRIDIYGKVVEIDPANRTARVRFTAVPGEIQMFFEGLSSGKPGHRSPRAE